MLSEVDGRPHSRPCGPWSSACLGRSAPRRPVGAAQGGPGAAAGRCSPCRSPAGEPTGLPFALDGQLCGWDDILRPDGRCVLAWAARFRICNRRGDGLIRCPFFAGHDWRLAEDAVGLTAGSQRLESARPCAAQLDLPQQHSGCVLWPSLASAYSARIPNCLDAGPDLVVISSDPAVAAANRMAGFLPATCGAGGECPVRALEIGKAATSSFC